MRELKLKKPKTLEELAPPDREVCQVLSSLGAVFNTAQLIKLEFSVTMHAVYPWNVTLTGRITFSGSFLVLRLNASSTPHAWTPRDLGFSLTGNWCVVWDPPLVAQLFCLTR